MITTQYRKFQEAKSKLTKLCDNPENILFIHYSCESFYERSSGKSPRITSIAVRFLESGQTLSFSIHQQAELEDVSVKSISDNYDQYELKMLTSFYDFVIQYRSFQWVHWNMRNSNYGFEAIAHRFRVLGGQPTEISHAKTLNLARLMHDLLGNKYVEHPRLFRLLDENNMVPRNFLSGCEEAQAFEKSEYVRLHQSTLSKVDAFMDITKAAVMNRLRCNNGYFKRRGFDFSTFVALIKDNPIVSIISLFAGITGLISFAFSLFD